MASKKELEAAVKEAEEAVERTAGVLNATQADLEAKRKAVLEAEEHRQLAVRAHQQADSALQAAKLALKATKPLSPTALAFLEAASKEGGHTYKATTYVSAHEKRSTRDGVVADAMMDLGFVRVETVGYRSLYGSRRDTATITPAGRAKLAEAAAKQGK